MPDTFVAIVALTLGCSLLIVAGGRSSWLNHSPMADRLRRSSGQFATRLVIAAVGGFMVFIGISLLNR